MAMVAVSEAAAAVQSRQVKIRIRAIVIIRAADEGRVVHAVKAKRYKGAAHTANYHYRSPSLIVFHAKNGKSTTSGNVFNYFRLFERYFPLWFQHLKTII